MPTVPNAADRSMTTLDVADGRVPFSAGGLVGSDDGFAWDNTDKKLTVDNLTVGSTAITNNGKLLQRVYASTASAFSTSDAFNVIAPLDGDGPPVQTDGVEVLTAAITPTSASSKLLVRAVLPCVSLGTAGMADAWVMAVAALFRDATAACIQWSSAVLYFTNASVVNPVTSLVAEVVVDSTATTATTFKLRVGPTSEPVNSQAVTVYVNKILISGADLVVTGQKATLTVEEYAQ